MKITIITVVYNGEKFLAGCIDSVIGQTHQDIEYIVVDGNSTDSTPKIIAEKRNAISKLITEPDNGMYDAINKGLKVATGNIIGLLNADDIIADETIVAQVAKAFEQNVNLDGVYGDLDYIHPKSGRVLRRWRSKQADFKDLLKGWMPAHPTFYLKRSLINRYGNYSLNFGTAGDYEFMLRYLFAHKAVCKYLPILMVKMRQGGISNQSFGSRISALKNDYKALKANKVPLPFLVLLFKKINKLRQYF